MAGAIFQGAKGLTPEALKLAVRSDAAILDRDFGRGSGLDASDLSGIDFSRFDFRYTNLAGRRMPNAVLVACNLNGVDLTGTDLQDANLSYASMRGANLGEAKLRRANLSGLNQPIPQQLASQPGPMNSLAMPSPQMPSGPIAPPQPRRGKGTDFRGADLREAYLGNADLQDADFSGAQLSGANFSSADLRGASFRNADLDGARLEYCLSLTHDQIKLARNWEKASLPMDVQVQAGLAKPLPVRTAGGPNNTFYAPSKAMPMPMAIEPAPAPPPSAPEAAPPAPRAIPEEPGPVPPESPKR